MKTDQQCSICATVHDRKQGFYANMAQLYVSICCSTTAMVAVWYRAPFWVLSQLHTCLHSIHGFDSVTSPGPINSWETIYLPWKEQMCSMVQDPNALIKPFLINQISTISIMILIYWLLNFPWKKCVTRVHSHIIYKPGHFSLLVSKTSTQANLSRRN